MRKIDLFKRDAGLLAHPNNVDNLLPAIKAITEEAKNNPNMIDQKLIDAVEFTIRNQVRASLIANYSKEGLNVVMNTVLAADDFKELIPDEEEKISVMWRWGAMYDLVSDQLKEVQEQEKSTKNSNYLNETISLQVGLKTDDKGQMVQQYEHMSVFPNRK